jgi:hypothetical protein
MSASAIADAIVTNLSAASVFGAGGVSKSSYRVLESMSGSCAVVSFADMMARPVTFGSPRKFDSDWTLEVTIFIKDTGDPSALLNKVFTATDGTLASLRSDDTLQGTSDGIVQISGGFEPGRAVETGGFTWLPVTFRVVVRELGT